MNKLLDVANVHSEGSEWAAGLTIETLQCSLSRATAALCLPAPVEAGHPNGGAPAGWALSPFAVIVQMRRSTLCQTSDPVAAINSALEGERERAAGHALWFGTGDASLWFGAEAASTVAPDATVAVALAAFYDKTVGVEPVIHMGLGTAFAQSGLTKEGRFKAFPHIPVVVNPGYAFDGLAISGPVEVWFGPPETTTVFTTSVNRENTEATMLGAVAVDPCTVVVRGDLPDQVYVGASGKSGYVYVINSAETATVNWGDGSAIETVPADSTSPVSHVYATTGPRTITVTSNSGVTTRQIVI